jgi:glucose-6-phosphate dehydrogenase assembly protein OpcA
MTTTYAILGQTIGTPALTTLYTAGASEQAVISTITIANRGTVADTYRIAVRPDGESIANQHYIAYDASCPGNDTIALTLGITLNGNDVVSVYSGTTNLTFNAFGAEIN